MYLAFINQNKKTSYPSTLKVLKESHIFIRENNYTLLSLVAWG